ncbi:MAG: dipeptidase [Croceibacterium sp.]
MKFVVAAVALALAGPLAARTAEEIAASALEAAPVWDGHNDAPIQLRARFGNVIGEFDFEDTRDTGPSNAEGRTMHTDFARLAQGKVGAQFWSVYVSSDLASHDAVIATIEQIDVTKRLIARYPDRLALALSAADVERAIASGKIASLLGMEGGHSIDGNLAILRQMYDLGARYMTLTHSKNTPWADSATAAPQHEGPTDFGRDVVREMQRIGMLVDLSHVSEATMHDALDVAGAPVIFSHSGAFGATAHPRNVPDRVLERRRGNGGIVMIVALPAYISEARRVWGAASEGEKKRLETLHPGDPDAVKRGQATWTAANPEPLATIADMADHVDQVRKVAGIDHIGVGGDYDGMATGPVGMEDVAGYPALFAELARRGYSQADLEKIASRNMLRVIKAAERYAAEHRDDPPIEQKVG